MEVELLEGSGLQSLPFLQRFAHFTRQIANTEIGAFWIVVQILIDTPWFGDNQYKSKVVFFVLVFVSVASAKAARRLESKKRESGGCGERRGGEGEEEESRGLESKRLRPAEEAVHCKAARWQACLLDQRPD